MSSASMNVPLVDLKRQHASISHETQEAFDAILSSMRLFLGPNVDAFQREFAEYLDVEHCIGVSDGTMALYLALRGCGVEPGDEVVTVSHTFFATVEAILLAGAVPVFVDIDPMSHTIDVAAAERAITKRTKALVPVHLYGRMADMDGIMEVARRHGLRVIEDSAQAHGARRNGKAAGTIGDVGCFSFYYSKNLGAYGEAGGVVTNDSDIAERVATLRDHGSPTRYHHEMVGVNGRLDEMQAAVLRLKLPKLDGWNELRRKHARRYRELLTDLALRTPLPAAGDHVYHLYVVQTPFRDDLQHHLESRGVHTGIHYPVPCHLQPACSHLGQTRGSLPVTEALADEILSLPMFPELEEREVEYVTEAIASFYDERAQPSSLLAAAG